MDTLSQAKKDWLVTLKGEGGNCPCCGRFGKIYERPLNQRTVRGLAWFYKAELSGKFDNCGGWVYVPSFGPRWMMRTYNHNTLKWWGLLDTKFDSPGFWRITRKGVSFVEGLISVPLKVWHYKDTPFGFSEEHTWFKDYDLAVEETKTPFVVRYGSGLKKVRSVVLDHSKGVK